MTTYTTTVLYPDLLNGSNVERDLWPIYRKFEIGCAQRDVKPQKA